MSARHRIVIVGAGFSGLGAAIRLKAAGIEDFVVLERADEVGGTWRANTYPGCQCDVPSHLYSYSFAPNPGWTRTYSRQAEIWDYLRRCVERHRLTGHLRLGVEVTECVWEEEEGRWLLTTSAGPRSAQILVAATGALSEPSLAGRARRPAVRGAAVSLRALAPRSGARRGARSRWSGRERRRSRSRRRSRRRSRS